MSGVNDLDRNKWSYEQLFAYFEEIAEKSEHINGFTRVDIMNLNREKHEDLSTPFLGLEDPAIMPKNDTDDDIEWEWDGAFIICTEIEREDESGYQEAMSRAGMILQKICAWILNDRELGHIVDFRFSKMRGHAVKQVFRNCAGYRMTFKMPSQFDMNMYAQDWSSWREGQAVPPFARVKDGAITKKLNAGDYYECSASPAVVIMTDTGGTELGSTSVAPGGTDTLVAPNGSIAVNAVPVGTVKSGGSANILLRYEQDTPVPFDIDINGILRVSPNGITGVNVLFQVDGDDIITAEYGDEIDVLIGVLNLLEPPYTVILHQPIGEGNDYLLTELDVINGYPPFTVLNVGSQPWYVTAENSEGHMIVGEGVIEATGVIPPVVVPVPELSIEIYTDAGMTNPLVGAVNYRSTIYIKLVSANIAPTSHTLFFGNGTKNAPQVTQAGNTLAWVVSLTGSVTISATAKEGTTAAADATPFVLTSNIVLSNALHLDGVNDTTTARLIPQLGEDWSVTFWVKMMNISRNNTFFSIIDPLGNSRPAFLIGFRKSTSAIVVAAWSTNWGATGGVITPDTDWHNYSITYDVSTTTLTVYLDSVILYSGNFSFNQPFTQFTIGYAADFPFVGSNYGNIKMADLRIFSDVLTQAEVVEVVNGTSSETPVQRYILDDGIGVTSGFLTDYVSNQYLLLRGITSPFGTDADIPY